MINQTENRRDHTQLPLLMAYTIEASLQYQPEVAPVTAGVSIRIENSVNVPFQILVSNIGFS
jgi:hypothetical protein